MHVNTNDPSHDAAIHMHIMHILCIHVVLTVGRFSFHHRVKTCFINGFFENEKDFES